MKCGADLSKVSEFSPQIEKLVNTPTPYIPLASQELPVTNEQPKRKLNICSPKTMYTQPESRSSSPMTSPPRAPPSPPPPPKFQFVDDCPSLRFARPVRLLLPELNPGYVDYLLPLENFATIFVDITLEEVKAMIFNPLVSQVVPNNMIM